LNNIPGDIVECGVWKGGMCKAALLAQSGFENPRQVWAYDTFEGMTEAGVYDTNSINDTNAHLLTGTNVASLETVQAYLGLVGITYVVGDCRKTVLEQRPDKISVLRLDVDWYENTKACLEALYPRLSVGGVLLIDDYPFWPGCVKAIQEYLPGCAREWIMRTGVGSGMVKEME
jgi:hypothetical protein